MTISRERIERFNPVTDVLDILLRDEDIKRLQEELGMPQQDGFDTKSREQKLKDIEKYVRS